MSGGMNMSVLIISYRRDFAVLCADKRQIKNDTGEIVSDDATKIEEWSPVIAVGYAGIAGLAKRIMIAAHAMINETGIDRCSVEDIGNLMCQGYYALMDMDKDVPRDALAIIVVAGKMANGKMGISIATLTKEIADLEIYEGDGSVKTIILEPNDIPEGKCYQLFNEAVMDIQIARFLPGDPVEMLHRRAVVKISEYSKQVGPKADFIYIHK